MTQSRDISRESTDVVLVQAESKDIIKLEKDGKQPLAGFLFFGCVGLLCFNFFLQSLVYFDTCFSKDFSQYANIIYGLSNNCGQLLVIFYGGNFPFAKRIYYSCVALAVILVAYPILAVATTDQSLGMSLGLLLTFGLGFFNAVLQSAGFGLAGICSSKTMNYFSLGQAVAGLAPFPLVLLLKTIFLAFGVNDVSSNTSRSADVDTACMMTSLAIAALVTVLMVPFYRFSLSQAPIVKKALVDLDSMKHSAVIQHRPKMQIIKDTLPLAISVWFVLYVTFVVFPAQALKWNPSYGPYPTSLGYVGMMIYVFQVFDVVGRYTVNAVALSPKQSTIASITRMALIPLFILATYQVSFFSNDFTRIVIMALLAATNGFVLSWCMINGPSQVHKDEMDVACYTMSFFLVNGIFFGSLTSLAISKISVA